MLLPVIAEMPRASVAYIARTVVAPASVLAATPRLPPGRRPSWSASFASPRADSRAQRRRALVRQRQTSIPPPTTGVLTAPASYERTAAGVQAPANDGSMPSAPLAGSNITCTEPLLRRRSRPRRSAPPRSGDDRADGKCSPPRMRPAAEPGMGRVRIGGRAEFLIPVLAVSEQGRQVAVDDRREAERRDCPQDADRDLLVRGEAELPCLALADIYSGRLGQACPMGGSSPGLCPDALRPTWWALCGFCRPLAISGCAGSVADAPYSMH
jgi:hypothetical protein